MTMHTSPSGAHNPTGPAYRSTSDATILQDLSDIAEYLREQGSGWGIPPIDDDTISYVPPRRISRVPAMSGSIVKGGAR